MSAISVEVVSSRTPVLSAPHSTCPCCPNLAHILGWSSQALACLVGAGDVVHNIGVLASDAVLDGPGLTSQGACVCVCIFGVNTTKTSCLSTLFEAWQCSTAGTSPPVHCRQLGSHENVSQVGWSQERHRWSSRHPLLHCEIPLHQKIVMLVQNARGVRQSSVKGERQDD